jgi:hypothetical protein
MDMDMLVNAACHESENIQIKYHTTQEDASHSLDSLEEIGNKVSWILIVGKKSVYDMILYLLTDNVDFYAFDLLLIAKDTYMNGQRANFWAKLKRLFSNPNILKISNNSSIDIQLMESVTGQMTPLSNFDFAHIIPLIGNKEIRSEFQDKINARISCQCEITRDSILQTYPRAVNVAVFSKLKFYLETTENMKLEIEPKKHAPVIKKEEQIAKQIQDVERGNPPWMRYGNNRKKPSVKETKLSQAAFKMWNGKLNL